MVKRVYSRNIKGFYRPTWAEIDLEAVKVNYGQVKKAVGPGVSIMVVVKANAYGHGIEEVSGVLENIGAEYLGVATLDEAILLRKRMIRMPILILGAVLPDELEAAIDNDITLTVAGGDVARAAERIAKRKKKKAKMHLKVDTGMGRIGVWHEEALQFAAEAASLKNTEMEGIYTHFSSAGRDKFFTAYQIDSFNALLQNLEKRGILPKYRHAANSIATFNLKKAHLNLVRPGIIIYGMYPKRSFARRFELKPALSLKTRVVFVKKVPAGRSISYGRTYITERATTIATLPIGYADGYGRILSNKARVLIKGQRANVVGKVTMDQTMIDVGHLKDVSSGDEAVLIGKQGENEIRCEELAKVAGTIPYEIVCSISNRVPRVYKYCR